MSLSIFTVLVLSLMLVHRGACGFLDGIMIGHVPVFMNMEEKLNWADALESCHRHNMTLVSIRTAEENAAITDLLPGRPDVWIGGYKKNGIWLWTGDGQPMNYTNWSAGEPNSLENDNEDCVHLTSWDKGKWNDVRCSDRNFYICENLIRDERDQIVVEHVNKASNFGGLTLLHKFAVCFACLATIIFNKNIQ
ncbi:perlucin-like protein [Lutzomyia longipalpis]|uniref:perlucin-like protein n=1 Tax=Lutzomyia longipalpis TaxID=7200 RepID=UPI0024846A2F|nr:perlucin-like protein [Lutzomyia longipalpis]